MKKIFILLSAVVTLSLVYSACNDNVTFDAVQHIHADGWHKDSAAVFDLPITDTIGIYTLYISLRNSVGYPYSNLFLFVKTIAPSGVFACDTIEYLLADSYGRWLGKGFSHIIDNRLEYRRLVQFPTTGIYRIEIKQGMRMYLLPEIIDVGLKVERTD
jgi:gliding motility-associated lipoprotein GldH